MNFASLFFAVQVLTNPPLPPGTPLEVRLSSTVGSYASKAGDAVSADLIVPVMREGQTILPAGSKLFGTLKSVQRVGFGLVHETAALDFAWNRVELPDGTSFPFSAKVQAVDTGRERVTEDGSIRGWRKTSSLAYRFSGYVRTAVSWEVHAPLALWMCKMLLVQLPEPELYYPAGVELSLQLTQPLLGPQPEPTEEIPSLMEPERDRLEPWVQQLPLRARDPKKGRPSDLVNIMFIGSRDDLMTTFAASGWTEAQPSNMRTRVQQIRAVSEGHGFLAAPMTTLRINDAGPDLSLQKGFNDLSKRHHIRIWKYPEEWDGSEVWIAAATRDVDFAFLRPGHPLTHKIERNVDNEREKVIHDLTFTECVETLDRIERPGIPSLTLNATGDPMNTDGRLAIVKLNDCESPRHAAAESGEPIPVHGNGVQRWVRREVLTFRNDMLRENVYWRSYEGVRWTVAALHEHWQSTHPRNLGIAADSEVQLARLRPRRQARGHAFGDLLR